jgi:hypothetical protein
MKTQKSAANTVIKSRVEIYSSGSIIRGFISRGQVSRLLDVLNQTGKDAGQSRADFLHITDAVICTPDNQQTMIPSIFLNTSNIFFIKEIEDGATKSSLKGFSSKVYPYVSKENVNIKFYMPFYGLTGKLHYTRRQNPMDVMNSGAQFFPLTEAKISCFTCLNETNPSFVAVNRKQVLYIEAIQL